MASLQDKILGEGVTFDDLLLVPAASNITNIFGLFGFLNSQCTAEKCTEEATRINWAGIHEFNNELGWSMPFPEMGIPDYVAVACSILVLIVAFRRK